MDDRTGYTIAEACANIEASRRMGALKALADSGTRLSAVSFPHVTIPTALLEGAAQHEKTKRHGATIGLADEEISEVMDVWLERFKTLGLAVGYPAIRGALTLRAAGLDWRP